MMSDSQVCSQLSILQIEEGSSSEYTSDDGEEFGDVHRLVLQVLFAAGWMDAKGVKKLFQETCKFLDAEEPAGEHMSPPFIQKVVREINEKTKCFDMMIRSATCEISGEKFYVFLVTTERQIMRFQTYFSKPELDLFQMITKSVLRMHNNFLITMNECINMSADLGSRFSKVHAEDFVNKMIALQYFAKVYKDNEEFEITLGFRTIREFEEIFRQNYANCFGTCCLCKMIVLNGLTCPTCPADYHRTCLKKYIKTCKTCVGCNGKWKNEESLRMRTMSSGGEGGAPLASSQETSEGSSSQASGGKAESNKATKTGDPTLEPSGSGEAPSTSSRTTTQESSSQASGGESQKKKATGKANATKTGDQVAMPTLEPNASGGAPSTSSQETSQGSSSQATGGKGQSKKAGGKAANSTKGGDEGGMPTLEPMVLPKIAEAKQSSKSKRNKDTPKLTPSASGDKNTK